MKVTICVVNGEEGPSRFEIDAPSTDTTKQLKEKIEQQEGIILRRLKLIFLGKVRSLSLKAFHHLQHGRLLFGIHSSAAPGAGRCRQYDARGARGN